MLSKGVGTVLYQRHENNTHVGKIALAPDIQHEHSILTASAEGARALFLKLLRYKCQTFGHGYINVGVYISYIHAGDSLFVYTS